MIDVALEVIDAIIATNRHSILILSRKVFDFALTNPTSVTDGSNRGPLSTSSDHVSLGPRRTIRVRGGGR